MPPVTRVLLTRKQSEGPCEQCPEAIPEGEVHATTVRTFGKSKAGKVKYQTLHLHLTCVPANLLADYLAYGERGKKAKKGKVRGPSIAPEHRDRRRKLIRTRARLLREVLAAQDEERILYLRQRIVLVQRELIECGGMPRELMMRRSPEAKAILDEKLALTTGG